MMRLLTIISVVTILTVDVCSGVNILMVDSLPSPSHQIFNYGIAEVLLERGHNVTMLGPLTISPLVHDNYTHIIIEDLGGNVMNEIGVIPDTSKMWLFQKVNYFLDYIRFACKYSYRSNGTKTLLNYPQDFKFDAIVLDATIEAGFLPLIQRFGYPPTVGMTAFLLPPYYNEIMGGNIQPAYLPSYHTQFTIEMSFFERLHNYFVLRYEIFMRKHLVKSTITDLSIETFGKNIDTLQSLLDHVSILLANWSPALYPPQPLPPNVIPVAGVHIKKNQLVKDVQAILDNAKDGIVLFSLGSNLRSADLTVEIREEILKAFSGVKATILWKFEEEINDLPKNVIVRKWIPQTNVLEHPNTKLFISHAGGLSTIEATYYGVPVLGVPFFADQHNNIDNFIQKGLSIKVDLATIKAADFLNAINEMLNNPKYSKGMKELSRRFRDEPNTPRERAAFWIEYVMRHGGAKFLSPKSRYLPLLVSSCTDIHLVLLAALIGTLLLIYRIKKVLTTSHTKENKQKTN